MVESSRSDRSASFACLPGTAISDMGIAPHVPAPPLCSRTPPRNSKRSDHVQRAGSKRRSLIGSRHQSPALGSLVAAASVEGIFAAVVRAAMHMAVDVEHAKDNAASKQGTENHVCRNDIEQDGEISINGRIR